MIVLSLGSRKFCLLVVLLACALINVIRFFPYDYEVESTKHYYSDRAYYGGYTWTYVETKEGFQPNQTEALHLWRNFSTLLNDGTDPNRPLVFEFGYEGPGRLLAGSLLPCLFTRFTFGLVSYSFAYFATNLFLWAISIWCIYQLGQIYFPESLAPLVAAILVACYPVFLLMLHSVKVQYAGIPFMLFGLYAYETKLKDVSGLRQFIFFFSYGLLGMISALGTVYLFVALVGIVLPRAWKEGRRTFGAALAGLILGALATDKVFRQLKINSSEPFKNFHVMDIIRESLAYIWAILQGRDTTGMKFLNGTGNDFFSEFLPSQFGGILDQNKVVCFLAILGFLTVPTVRKFGVTALMLFLPATAPILINGDWYTYHYGYCTAPIMIMLFFACSGFLGHLLSHRLCKFRLAGIVLFSLALIWFCWGQKKALSNYFGNIGAYRVIPAFVYHGNDCKEY